MSEFKELVKNFSSVRNYMRDFYLYGFKCRSEFGYKSPRTYDNERRRLEIWLKNYVEWDYTSRGKNLFLSIDSAQTAENPLYTVWKSKSFTHNDIFLHFYFLHILSRFPGLTSYQIAEKIDEMAQVLFEPQTIRNKLKEYTAMGILNCHKKGKTLVYYLAEERTISLDSVPGLMEAIIFFSETAPFGFIGSILLDREKKRNTLFRFKHHFIVHTLEDEILMQAVKAREEKRRVEVFNFNQKLRMKFTTIGIPVEILTSIQNGRRYLCLYQEQQKRRISLRLDYIERIKIGEVVPEFLEKTERAKYIGKDLWGVSQKSNGKKDRVRFAVYANEKQEPFILERLEREKRMGRVRRLEQDVFVYETEVADANEMLPWIKTFIGRILWLECSDSVIERKFYADIRSAAAFYGLREK